MRRQQLSHLNEIRSFFPAQLHPHAAITRCTGTATRLAFRSHLLIVTAQHTHRVGDGSAAECSDAYPSSLEPQAELVPFLLFSRSLPPRSPSPRCPAFLPHLRGILCKSLPLSSAVM